MISFNSNLKVGYSQFKKADENSTKMKKQNQTNLTQNNTYSIHIGLAWGKRGMSNRCINGIKNKHYYMI